MKIAVIISQVPDTTTKIEIASDAKSIDESNIEWILNPYAEFAVEKALLLKEAHDAIEEVIILALGPDRTVSAIRSALAMGADQGILLKTDVLDAQALADKIKELGIDLVLGAKKNIDIEAAWLEAGVAAHLDLPVIANANKLSFEADKLIVEREASGAKEKFELSLPALVTCDKGQDEPRYASVMGLMKAKKKPLEEIDISATDTIGIEAVKAELPKPREAVKIFEGSPEEAAKQLVDALKNEAKVL